jgi:hypothetical protein
MIINSNFKKMFPDLHLYDKFIIFETVFEEHLKTIEMTLQNVLIFERVTHKSIKKHEPSIDKNYRFAQW